MKDEHEKKICRPRDKFKRITQRSVLEITRIDQQIEDKTNQDLILSTNNFNQQ